MMQPKGQYAEPNLNPLSFTHDPGYHIKINSKGATPVGHIMLKEPMQDGL